MSEEEIIKEIKETLNAKYTYIIGEEYININKSIVQGLLDLYNKEKEKNKELENIKKEFIWRSNATNKMLLERGYISKDKIINKIKEFEKPLLDIAEEQKFDFNYTLDGLSAISKAIPKVLEDLLKED